METEEEAMKRMEYFRAKFWEALNSGLSEEDEADIVKREKRLLEFREEGSGK
jgi:hypothetical protein